jgi:hypothetical protein
LSRHNTGNKRRGLSFWSVYRNEKPLTGKVRHLIVLYIGNVSGFVEGKFLTIELEKTADCHEEINN